MSAELRIHLWKRNQHTALCLIHNNLYTLFKTIHDALVLVWVHGRNWFGFVGSPWFDYALILALEQQNPLQLHRIIPCTQRAEASGDVGATALRWCGGFSLDDVALRCRRTPPSDAWCARRPQRWRRGSPDHPTEEPKEELGQWDSSWLAGRVAQLPRPVACADGEARRRRIGSCARWLGTVRSAWKRGCRIRTATSPDDPFPSVECMISSSALCADDVLP
jgi:hypothetical protein